MTAISTYLHHTFGLKSLRNSYFHVSLTSLLWKPLSAAFNITHFTQPVLENTKWQSELLQCLFLLPFLSKFHLLLLIATTLVVRTVRARFTLWCFYKSPWCVLLIVFLTLLSIKRNAENCALLTSVQSFPQNSGYCLILFHLDVLWYFIFIVPCIVILY